MRANEFISEAFNQPYKTKSEKSEYGDVDMLAKLPDGSNLSIMFIQDHGDEGEEVTQVEFWRNNSQEVTGEGDAQRIFATVLATIQKYIKKHKPQRLSFSASKEPEADMAQPNANANPESRAKLYDRLVQRYAKAWGYRAFRADTGKLVRYELSRLQPAVAEDLTRRSVLKGLAGAAGAAALGAATSAKAGEYQDYATLTKDKQKLETVWVPRMQQLQQRCNSMVAKLIRTAGSSWAESLKGTTVTVNSNQQYIQAEPEQRSISVDLTVFWDAPDDTLAFAIGHELGHIALKHIDDAPSPEQSRKDEMDADDFAVRLCKALGYNKANMFKFIHAKKGEYEFFNQLASQPNSTHPNYNQRMDKAKQQGFQLSKGGIQQMNTLMTHLA